VKIIDDVMHWDDRAADKTWQEIEL
jgi:hypothetical protein